MSMPNKAQNYGDKAVIDPASVIQECKKIGLHPSYPELTGNLCTAFERKSIQYSKGSSWTTDAPYRGTIEELRQYWSEGVAMVEMEASALFTIANLKRLRAGAILAVDSNLVTGIKKGEFEPGERTGELDQRVQRAIEDEIKIAIEAVKLLEVSHSFT